METQFNTKDKNKIQKAIRKKYKKVAKSPDGLFKYPTGKSGLETLHHGQIRAGDIAIRVGYY
jgi:hypothetical protein